VVDPLRAPPAAWSLPGRTTLELRTGAWRTRRPLYVEMTAPCRTACPAGEGIAQWIERARAGDYVGAWRLIREDNPFPAVTGRVCAHPCEGACNRAGHDGAVAVNALERFVGDWGLQHGLSQPVPVTRRQWIAVVGAGPAGLACAYHAVRLGYRATVFDAAPLPGGLLRYGIPEYRLPRAVLDREIDLVLGLGVEFAGDRRLGADLRWEELEDYDAVFVATGAAVPMRLDVPGESAARIRYGVDWLRAVNVGDAPTFGDRVVVIGGGSAAMDVARTARRLGARAVTVLALEARAVMPALADEVRQALAEGIEIRNNVGVTGFVETGGAVSAVHVAPVRLLCATDGGLRPLYADGPRATLPADDVVLAIGHRPDLSILPADVAHARGAVVVDAHGATTHGRIFAGGDCVSGRSVAGAIGAGTRAARVIHARLSAPAGEAPDDEPRPHGGQVVPAARIGRHAFAPAPRAPRRELRPAGRTAGFAEVVLGLGRAAARAEAERCYACGHCVGCDICEAVCPDMAITRVGDGYRVAGEHCKGCGLCAAECPRGALEMVSES